MEHWQFVKKLKLPCPTLCSLMDCSPPGCSVHGVFQARIQEWVAISYFRGSFQPWDRTGITCVCCIGQANSLSLSHLGNPQDSAVPLLGMYPEELKIDSNRYLYTIVHSNIIHSIQNNQQVKMLSTDVVAIKRNEILIHSAT